METTWVLVENAFSKFHCFCFYLEAIPLPREPFPFPRIFFAGDWGDGLWDGRWWTCKETEVFADATLIVVWESHSQWIPSLVFSPQWIPPQILRAAPLRQIQSGVEQRKLQPRISSPVLLPIPHWKLANPVGQARFREGRESCAVVPAQKKIYVVGGLSGGAQLETHMLKPNVR